MEAVGQKYSVLTKAEVREKVMIEIDQISEVFSVSKSDATVILIHLRWNSYKASDLLGDDKEKFLAKLGLVQVFDSNSCSADHETTLSDGDGDDFVSTPFCSHKFSTTRWGEYLSDSLEKNKEERGLISCIHQDCLASVGPDTIEQLTESVKEMYESYVLGSFVESNKGTIKWCPAKGCGYAIELHGDKEDESGVVCVCGHIFCWTCQLESHRPVTCKNASLWWNYFLDHSRSLFWIHSNTKRCPNCNSPVEQNGDPDFKLITCICSWSFCWACLRSEEEHNVYWNCAGVSVPPVDQDSSSNEFIPILNLNLWEEGQAAMEKAKSKLKDIETNMIPKLKEHCVLVEQDIQVVREGWMVIVQCRQVLKWSYVFDYMTEYQNAKKEYLSHLRDEASKRLCKHEETLHELIDQALSAGNLIRFTHIIKTSTASTGNFFHGFIKSLEDGLPEVEANANEDAQSRHCFCERCTFENRWVDKQCKMCFVPLDSSPPPPVARESDV